jgi:hypothetical protein
MTDNLQLQTSRLTNASAGNLLDSSITDIENCLSVLFGITKDSPVSQVMTIASTGDVTMIGDLTLAGAPTLAMHAATKLYADDNAGAGTAASYYVDVGGLEALSLGGGVTDQNVPLKGDDESLGWANEEYGDADQFDYATNNKVLICKSAGDYLIYGQFKVRYDDGADVKDTFGWHLNLEVNGSAIMEAVANGYQETDVYYARRSFAIMRTLALNDEVGLVHDNLYAAPWDTDLQDTWLGMVKVG